LVPNFADLSETRRIDCVIVEFDNVGEGRVERNECLFQILEDLFRLRNDVALADQFAGLLRATCPEMYAIRPECTSTTCV
jgi:hypothetical protein